MPYIAKSTILYIAKSNQPRQDMVGTVWTVEVQSGGPMRCEVSTVSSKVWCDPVWGPVRCLVRCEMSTVSSKVR